MKWNHFFPTQIFAFHPTSPSLYGISVIKNDVAFVLCSEGFSVVQVFRFGDRYEKFFHFPQWYSWPTQTSIFVLRYDSAVPMKKLGEKRDEVTDDHDHVLHFVFVT